MVVQPLVSIAICTRNRPNALANLLASIERAVYSRKEIIIVDSSNCDLAGNVEEISKSYKCRYIYESESGISKARNTAINVSRGEFIAFTDDDCIVDENWIGPLIKNFSKPVSMCVTGRILSTKVEDDLFERFLSLEKGTRRREFSVISSPIKILPLFRMVTQSTALKERGPIPWCIGSGSNMAFRREVFRSIGMFDERLEGAEEIDMFFRIYSHGWELVYEPEALVYHNHEHGDSLDRLANRFFCYGKFSGCFLKKHSYAWKILLIYFGHFINLATGIFETLLRQDKSSCYLQYKQLLGMLSSINCTAAKS